VESESRGPHSRWDSLRRFIKFGDAKSPVEL
jgi:hypothetical protein